MTISKLCKLCMHNDIRLLGTMALYSWDFGLGAFERWNTIFFTTYHRFKIWPNFKIIFLSNQNYYFNSTVKNVGGEEGNLFLAVLSVNYNIQKCGICICIFATIYFRELYLRNQEPFLWHVWENASCRKFYEIPLWLITVSTSSQQMDLFIKWLIL